MDYKNSKIYQIICNETGLCYIGSTTQSLSKRLSKHKTNYKEYLENKIKSYTTSFFIIENRNYDIVLIEEYPCENKEQLHKRERYYIENMKCVNKNIPSRTRKEWYEENKEKHYEKSKEWRENNKEKVKEYKKEWRNKENNKEKIKEWFEINKEKFKEYRKEYYEKNKEKIKEKSKEWRENNKN